MRSECERCNGTGWLVRPAANGTDPEPGNGGPSGAPRAWAERCTCIVERAALQRVFQSRIPKKFSAATFESFEANQVALHRAKEVCRRLVAGYPKAKRGLLFMGNAGVGKTHLAVATLRGLLDAGADGIFYDFRELLDELRSSYDAHSAESEKSILHRVFSVEVLVLDELGSEKLTDWVREVLHRLIIRRYNDERLTIFTTNYLDKELLTREKEVAGRDKDSSGSDADTFETLEGRIGYRLRSRLYEMCDTVSMLGRDFRQQHRTFEKLKGSPSIVRMPSGDDDPEARDLEVWVEKLRKMAAPLRQQWIDRARTSFRTAMPKGTQVEERAAKLLRDDEQDA